MGEPAPGPLPLPEAVPFSRLFVEFDKLLPAIGLLDPFVLGPVSLGIACMEPDDVVPFASPVAVCAIAHDVAATIAMIDNEIFRDL